MFITTIRNNNMTLTYEWFKQKLLKRQYKTIVMKCMKEIKNNNSSFAYTCLGYLYTYSYGVPYSNNAGQKYYKLAMYMNDPYAFYYSALIWINSYSKDNYFYGVACLFEANKLNKTLGNLELGNFYCQLDHPHTEHTKLIGPPNYDIALKYYNNIPNSSPQNIFDKLLSIGKLYNLKKEYMKAFHHYYQCIINAKLLLTKSIQNTDMYTASSYITRCENDIFCNLLGKKTTTYMSLKIKKCDNKKCTSNVTNYCNCNVLPAEIELLDSLTTPEMINMNKTFDSSDTLCTEIVNLIQIDYLKNKHTTYKLESFSNPVTARIFKLLFSTELYPENSVEKNENDISKNDEEVIVV